MDGEDLFFDAYDDLISGLPPPVPAGEVHIYTNIRIYTFIYAYICIFFKYLYVYIYICIYLCICLNILYVFVYRDILTYYTYVYMYKCIHIYINIGQENSGEIRHSIGRGEFT
jgi:hypothetical protein